MIMFRQKRTNGSSITLAIASLIREKSGGGSGMTCVSVAKPRKMLAQKISNLLTQVFWLPSTNGGSPLREPGVAVSKSDKAAYFAKP